MSQTRKTRNLSREEDYRDYQDRNSRDGWPYSDESGFGSADPKNRAYGTTPANFDEEPNSGLIADTATATGLAEEAAHTFGPLPTDRVDSDELEAAITERLAQSDEIDADSIDVHADKGVVTLEGSVETDSIVRAIELLALSMPGVIEVRNNLLAISVDSHIPPDA